MFFGLVGDLWCCGAVVALQKQESKCKNLVRINVIMNSVNFQVFFKENENMVFAKEVQLHHGRTF